MGTEEEELDTGSRLFDLPAGWSTSAGPGYRIHTDGRVEETIGFAEAVARGLEEHPRSLPYRYLYDRRGSEIYEKITEQPEYYPTRTEERILAAHADEIRERVGDAALVEFGSGSSAKTCRLLDAWRRAGDTTYVPIDISIGALESACGTLADEYPGLELEALCASYERAVPVASGISPVCFVFLGSTVGNFHSEALDRFLEMIARHLAPGDSFLLGIDLVKEPAVLEAAYNDAAGWTERFTLNLFERMNRELGTGIPLDAVEHVAYYNDRLERIEIFARFNREVMVELASIDRRFRIAPGEMIRTEISRKFRSGEMAATAARFGLIREALYTDPEELFGLLLLRRSRTARATQNRAMQLEVLLTTIRSRTRQILEPLSAEELVADPGPPMGPILWDLGHIADFERLWLVDSLGSSAGEGLDPTYDPNVHPRQERGTLSLPSEEEVWDRLEATRERALQLLREGGVDPADPLTRDGFVYRMVAQHEAQHQETMLQSIQMMRETAYTPAFLDAPPIRPDTRAEEAMVLVPGGPCTIGTDDRTVAYDNERPRHTVEVPSFRIDAAPVTNGEFLRFMREGGYEADEHWSPEGRAWRDEHDVRCPMYWESVDGEWMRRVFGALRRLDPTRPIMHVSWYEADAYARRAGKRLPTEAEWEKAAAWDPSRSEASTYPWGEKEPNSRLANLGGRLLEPQHVGTYPRGRSFYGCHQMLGDVYEWTASDFEPYPGFEAFPYREYSEVFFGDTYKVLRGASWAVPTIMARNTYRNWDLPERRQLFAGFRCAADA